MEASLTQKRLYRYVETLDVLHTYFNVCAGNSVGNARRLCQHRERCAGASKYLMFLTPTLMYAQEIRSEIHGGFDEMKQLASQVCIVYIRNLISMADDGPRWLHQVRATLLRSYIIR